MRVLKTVDIMESAEEPVTVDQETLDAIDAGIRAADAGDLVPLEEVRKLIPKWISKLTSQGPR